MSEVAAVLLAGGLARRMGGGDKPLRRLGGTTVLERVIERVRPQVAVMAINANGDPGRFADFALPVIPDPLEGFLGPLAGILAGLDWVAREHPAIGWLLSVPTDSPFLPVDLVPRLRGAIAAEGADMACARSGQQIHPVVGLWPIWLRSSLRTALADEGLRKIDLFTARYTLVKADWPAEPVDPFFNANSPEDLEEAERLLARMERR